MSKSCKHLVLLSTMSSRTISYLVLILLCFGTKIYCSTMGESPPRNTETQLNCTTNPGICPEICGESGDMPYSSTFCDPSSGSCVCDCRDTLSKSCIFTPFTPCFQDCVRKNPNPSVYLYEGGNCPTRQGGGGQQCACECSLRDDYIETNDI